MGTISKALKKELSKTKWKFDWLSLQSKNSILFKIEYEEEIQGLIKMTKVNEGYYEMSNLKLSPENYGSNGKFNNLARYLIAFACLITFQWKTGNYM